MFDSVKLWFGVIAVALVVLATGRVPARDGLVSAAAREINVPGRELPSGQHGGDLQVLRSFLTWPGPGESNFFLDLWEPGALSGFARIQGLTNNHALFIDSHGTEYRSWKGRQYAFRPGTDAGREGGTRGIYSIQDVARVLGRSSLDVHNIVIAGCNESGALNSKVVRRYFVNATNIVYMAAGERAYKPQFFQMLMLHSKDLPPLYERVISMDEQRVHAEILRTPSEGTRQLGWYVADLFRPGETKPFLRQRAGRELLDPTTPRLPAPSMRVERKINEAR